MRVCLYEDNTVDRLEPLCLTRPVFELRSGLGLLRDKLLRPLPDAHIGVFIRGYLTDVYRQDHPAEIINELDWLAQGPTLMLNGRWSPPRGWTAAVDANVVGRIDAVTTFLTARPDDMKRLRGQTFDHWLAELALTRRPVHAAGSLVTYPWDLVHHNADQIRDDFRSLPASDPELRPTDSLTVVGPPHHACVHATAEVHPFVVFDTRGGPIVVEPHAVLMPFTRIEGPCAIGEGSQLFGAVVRAGTTIGPHCRVGGEVESSILQGYVNKYHAGFLGHSYLGEWTNLGADTNTSDLRNDYAPVRVPLAGDLIDTGLLKVGAFIGDHTRAGMACLLNTGSNIGVMCTLLPTGLLLPKHIPSFTSLWRGRLSPGWDLDRLLAAAEVAMSRRGRRLTDAHRELHRHLYDLTADDRDTALRRAAAKDAHPLVAETHPTPLPE